MLLDYCVTYPNDEITYRASGMTLCLCGHSDAGLNNESESRSKAGAHVILSEGGSSPQCNVPVLIIAQIMKSFCHQLQRSRLLRYVFLTAKEMVSLKSTLDEMRRKQSVSPLQCGNSTAVGYTNQTMISKTCKTWNLRLR